MKRRFISWVYMALILLAALAFPGCPLEDEVPTGGSTIRLTNIPAQVLVNNTAVFIGVFTNKNNIGPRGGNGKGLDTEPLTGYLPHTLKYGYLDSFLKGGNSIEVSFGGALTGSQRYVLVLGMSWDTKGTNGTTYATNGDGKNNGSGGGGDFLVPGNGAPINPVLVNYDKNGVAEIDFSENFKYTGTREDLLANKGGAW
jgi:hypothetical protein